MLITVRSLCPGRVPSIDIFNSQYRSLQEPGMGDLKSDLLAAKEEIAALQNAKELSVRFSRKIRLPFVLLLQILLLCVQYLRRPANLAAEDDGAESGSDYGDWGENDDWSVDSFSPPSSFTSKSSLSRPENKKVQ